MGDYNMDKRIALVTGGNSGIGQATVCSLARKGFEVLFTHRKDKGVEDTLNCVLEVGGSCRAYKCDIADISATRKLVEEIISEYGAIDVLVNCAGISNTKTLEEIDEAEWDNMLDINLKGTFFLMKEVFLRMEQVKKGKLVTVTSIAGQRGGYFSGMHYCASKGGLETLVKCFALQGAEYGITSNGVSPGIVNTPMAEAEGLNCDGVPIGRMAEADEIASVIAFLASDESAYITGMTIDVNGGQLMR